MDQAAKRSAVVGEVRRLVSEGMCMKEALGTAGVSETNFRRWEKRLISGGVAALADRPKSGRPPSVRLGDDERDLLRRIYLQSNRAERSGSMTMAARIAARDPANCLKDETRAAILADRCSKHHLPAEVRRAMREVSPTVVARYRDPREGANNGIYVPGWLRRDEETGRLLLPGERQVWDDASVNVAVAVPWAGRGDKAGDRWGWRAARYQLLAVDALFVKIHRTDRLAATARQVWAVIFTLRNRAAKRRARTGLESLGASGVHQSPPDGSERFPVFSRAFPAIPG